MSAYPDWVNQYKQKGTTIKKVGNSYYLYKSTSRRMPGKKYPQPVQSYMGTITQEGLKITSRRKVSTETVRVYEFGFSHTLSKIIPSKFKKDIGDESIANYVFLNIVKQYSPDSYLLRGVELPTMEELHMSLCAQTKKFERLVGFKLGELLPLIRMYLVETREYDMISESTPEMKELMERVGVSINDIQP